MKTMVIVGAVLLGAHYLDATKQTTPQIKVELKTKCWNQFRYISVLISNIGNGDVTIPQHRLDDLLREMSVRDLESGKVLIPPIGPPPAPEELDDYTELAPGKSVLCYVHFDWRVWSIEAGKKYEISLANENWHLVKEGGKLVVDPRLERLGSSFLPPRDAGLLPHCGRRARAKSGTGGAFPIRGVRHLSQQVSNHLLGSFAMPSHSRNRDSQINVLSDRELEVFELIGRGRSTHDIADQLCLCLRTVEAHRTHIREKLELQSATDVVRHAVVWVESQT